MTILFVSENYFPNVSGVPVVVRYLAEGLTKRGHDVSIATQCYGDSPLSEVINGVKVNRFNIWQDWKHSYKGNTESFINFVINKNSDVTIFECVHCITTDLLLPHLKSISGCKILHSHGMPSYPHGRVISFSKSIKHTLASPINWVRTRYYYLCQLSNAIRNFDVCMCLSKVDTSLIYYERHSIHGFILDNAADDAFFDSSIEGRDVLGKYVRLENENYFISCANYQFIKNQQGIISEYYHSESSKTASLICIGSQQNDYYNDCLSLVNGLEKSVGHRDVHLLTGVERKDIPSLLNKASLYLVGSRGEQYSISIIEAMSQGVPFISTNVGNARVLLHEYVS